MSHYVEGSFKTFVVGSVDLPVYTAVKFGTAGDAGKLVAASAATDLILGVVQAAAKAGTAIDVHLRSSAGTINTKVGAGGAIAVNAPVTSDASGLGVTASVAGNQILGYALEAGAVGQVIELLPTTAKY